MKRIRMDSINDVWDLVCDKCKSFILEGRLSEPGYNTWIKILRPVSLENNEVTMAINSEFKMNIVKQNYCALLEECFEDILGFPVKLKFVVRDTEGEAEAPIKPSANFTLTDSNYSFENFIVGSSNSLAHAAALAVAERPSAAYNPLFIYGNSGVGKTHLLLAIHNRIKEKFPEKKQLYVRTEDFTNELISALHYNRDAVTAFRNRYRDIDVLMMDDIQFIAGKESTQEEFFNTFNTLLQNDKQIVLTSDRPPKDIKTLDERIRYRFEGALLTDIAPPDFETRVGIIKRKAENSGLELNDDVVYYVAEQVKNNIRQLEGVVKNFQAHINIEGGKVDLSMARMVIRDIKSSEISDPITADKIISEVARTYSVSESDILSKKKNGPIVFARQVAIYITRSMMTLTQKKIGEIFSIDHSTVVYSLGKIESILKSNPHEKEIVDDIIKNLQDM